MSFAKVREVTDIGYRRKALDLVMWAGGVVAACCLAFSAISQAPVSDEFGHFYAGLRFWQYGDTRTFMVNPPLVRGLATAPAYLAGLRVVETKEDHGNESLRRPEFWRGRQVFIGAPESFQFWLSVGRLGVGTITLLGAVLLYRWATQLAGNGAGVMAAGLWLVQPQILSHGVLLSGDVICAVLMLATLRALAWSTQHLTLWHGIVLGCLLGLAILTKFTAILLFAVVPLTILWQADRHSLRRLLVFGILVLAVALAIIGIPYGYRGWGTSLAEMKLNSRALSDIQLFVVDLSRRTGMSERWLIVPLPVDVVLGLDRQQVDFEIGLVSYAAGIKSEHGWWWFYIYSMLVKLPLGTLCAIAVAAGLFLTSLAKNSFRWMLRTSADRPIFSDGLQGLGLPTALLLLILFATAAASGFAQQHRYILTAYPPMLLVVSVIICRSKALIRSIGWLALAASLLCAMCNAPHWLSTFNLLAGGRTTGFKCLFNDASDWGQDSYLVREWCRKHAGDRIYVCSLFSGHKELRAIGAEFESLPENIDSLKRPCWIAVSKSDLVIRLWLQETLDEYKPADCIGGSHLVYYLSAQD